METFRFHSYLYFPWHWL